MTSRQLHGTSPTLIVPVGSTEQHGPHLPLDTDTRIATAVARAGIERLARSNETSQQTEWSFGPALGYGASGEHEGFPGTISIGTAALYQVLVEFGRSACAWAARLVFVNGHGGNVEALSAAVALLRREHREVAWCSCTANGGDAHAGHSETSVLLHISPQVVAPEHSVPGIGAPLAELIGRMRVGGIAAVSPVGVLGDPTTATAEAGAEIFAEMVDGCVERISRWAPDANGMLR